MNTKSLLAAALSAVCLLLASCGYRAQTSGRSSQLPASVTTIYVPAFANKTTTYNIDQMLTAAVVREFEQRTKYQIETSNRGDADATLHGTILSTYTSPLTYDSTSGRASSALVLVNMSVTLTDKNGKVLFENQDYAFREQYEISTAVASFFEEESPALLRVAHDFSRQLVSDVLESF